MLYETGLELHQNLAGCSLCAMPKPFLNLLLRSASPVSFAALHADILMPGEDVWRCAGLADLAGQSRADQHWATNSVCYIRP